MTEAKGTSQQFQRVVRLLDEACNYLNDIGKILKSDPTIDTLVRLANSYIIEAQDELDPEFVRQNIDVNQAKGLIYDASALTDAMHKLILADSPARGPSGMAAVFLLDARQSLEALSTNGGKA